MDITQLATSLAWICSLVMTVYTVYFLVISLFSLKKPRRYPHAAPAARFAVAAFCSVAAC